MVREVMSPPTSRDTSTKFINDLSVVFSGDASISVCLCE